MEKFAKYMTAIDGRNDWAAVQPLYDDAFDPDLVFLTPDGEYDKAGWARMVKGLVDKGAVASDFEITSQAGDTAYWHVTVTVTGGEPLHMTAKGTLKDGRLVRVEPVDPSVYADLIERSR